MILGLTGYARSGKDTAAQALIANGWQRVAFADAVRDCMYALNPVISCDGERLREVVELLGWDEAKRISEVRRLLQVFGTEVVRKHIGQNTWIDIAYKKTRGIPAVVITDVRFDNEAAAIHSWCGKVIRIVRTGVEGLNGHASESGVSENLIDRTILNDGSIDDLHANITEVARGFYTGPVSVGGR